MLNTVVRPVLDSAYSAFYSRVLYPAWESGLRHRPTLAYLAELQKTEWASRDELEALQLRKLRRLVAHAHANVPYYRKVLDEAGVTPDSIRHLDDLRRLPILSRIAAREAGASRESTAEPKVAIRKVTSGSSGQSLAFGYDWDSEHWRNAIRLRGYSWAGYHPGTPSVHFWGAVRGLKVPWKKQTKVKLDRALRREVHVDCSYRSDEVLQQAVDAIRRLRPSILVCYTQAGVDLARYVLAKGLRDWTDINVVCGAERLFAADRPLLEGAFGKGLFETYGSRETMLLAMESEAHEGLLVSMENILMEVLVREPDGRQRPALPGETGEVVVTDLNNLGMPFIRYENGDLATVGPRTTSPCGRAHQRLAGIEGRVTETMFDANGQRISGLVFNVMFSTFGYAIRQFQAVQHKDRSVTLRVVPSERWSDDMRQVIQATADRYLPGLPFTLEEVADIAPSPSGKRRVLVVEK